MTPKPVIARDRLFDILMRRFEAMADYKDDWQLSEWILGVTPARPYAVSRTYIPQWP